MGNTGNGFGPLGDQGGWWVVDGGGLTWLGGQTAVEVMGDTPFSFFYFIFSFFLLLSSILVAFPSVSFLCSNILTHSLALDFFSFLLLFLISVIIIIIIIYINRAVGGVAL